MSRIGNTNMGNISSSFTPPTSSTLPPPGQQSPGSSTASPKQLSSEDLSKGASEYQSSDVQDDSKKTELEDDASSGTLKSDKESGDAKAAGSKDPRRTEGDARTRGPEPFRKFAQDSEGSSESSSYVNSKQLTPGATDYVATALKGGVLASSSLNIETSHPGAAKLQEAVSAVHFYVSEDRAPLLAPPPPANVYVEVEAIGVLSTNTQLETLQAMIEANNGLSIIEQADYTAQINSINTADSQQHKESKKQHTDTIVGYCVGAVMIAAAVVLTCTGVGAPLAVALFIAGASALTMSSPAGAKIIAGLSEMFMALMESACQTFHTHMPPNAQMIANVLAMIIIVLITIIATAGVGAAAAGTEAAATGTEAAVAGTDTAAAGTGTAAEASETAVATERAAVLAAIGEAVAGSADMTSTAADEAATTSEETTASMQLKQASSTTATTATTGETETTTSSLSLDTINNILESASENEADLGSGRLAMTADEAEVTTASTSKFMTNAVRAAMAFNFISGATQSTMSLLTGMAEAKALEDKAAITKWEGQIQEVQSQINISFSFIQQMEKSINASFVNAANTIAGMASPLEDLGKGNSAA